MSAGSGIRHSEMNASATADVHLVQMWVLPDTEGIEPGYEQRDLNDALDGGGLVVVASGQGHEGAVSIHQRDAALSVGRLGAGETVTVPDAPHVARVRRRGRRVARRHRTRDRRRRPAHPRGIAHAHCRRATAPKCWSGRPRDGRNPSERRRRRLVGTPHRRAATPLDRRGTRRRAPPARSRTHARPGGRRARGAGCATPTGVVVGFDFSFSLPEWFLRERGFAECAGRCGTPRRPTARTWLRDCEPPFWGRPGRARPGPASPSAPHRGRDRRGRRHPPEVDVPGRRRRERRAPARSAGSPRSRRLQDAGYAIWPFDAPSRRPRDPWSSRSGRGPSRARS